ncbi:MULTISPECIES: polysaccharide deacetylase family protein [Enterococcus]|uniref:polysaccharide deacetylase family protein n=1 Tax=Enterococcus TaxID=1350 RepID=UPI0018837F5F|nr:polysaccharide deacetylase family protein [Enterococcus innesii]MBF0015480.1 polysaccharide deacetylase family protein [Enterococcus casseliflavus]MCO5496731.1 polysaccharide deacetylase family protein [Enterococcus innesii]MEB5919886.1 polysaccharide deacetylase family protein [Enterococcus innesii]
MRKKLLLIAIFCALILTLVVGAMYKYLMSQVYGEEQTNFETQVEKTIKTEFFDRDITQIEESKSGDNQYNKYYLYYSATENKNIIKQLEAQTQVASKQLKDSRSMVVSYVNEEKVNDALINRQLVTKEYIWDDKTKSLKYLGELKELSEILLSKNRNEPRLKDIVNDESDLLAINRIVQEQLLSTRTKLKSTIDEEELDQVLTNDFLSKDSKITILPHSIQIAFDKEVLGVTTMNVDIEKILPFINPAIVSDNNLPKKSLDQKRNYIALTFDDGPNDTSTKKLLGELKKEKIKATFFVLGQMVDKNPEVAKKIVGEGHEIGSHSYTHPDLTQVTLDKVKEEVLKTDKAIFHATGVLPKLFRPPYGAVNGAVAKTIGLPIIQWNVDSEDWQVKNKDLIVNKVIDTVENGSIILIHDIHERSVESIPEMVSQLRKRGYEFVTISELLSYGQKPLNQYFGLADQREIK